MKEPEQGMLQGAKDGLAQVCHNGKGCANENNKVRYKELVIRIDQKLKDLIEGNTKEHNQIITNIETLCNHVNDELGRMDKRINKLEHLEIIRKTQWKTLLFIASGTASVTIFLLKIIEFILNLKG